MDRLDEKAFLIKLDADHFVREVNGNTITTSAVPSSCPSMDYGTADAVARLLRRRRFGTAYVSDLQGRPVTGAMLREAQAADPGEATVNLPRTLKELDAMSASEWHKRMQQDPAFRARVDELEAHREAQR